MLKDITNVNLTKWTFLLFATFVGMTGALLHGAEDYVPLFIRKTFKYGKYAEKKDHFLVRRLELPKRWFSHFYIFAAPATTATFLILVIRYFFDGNVPECINWILDFQLGSPRKALVSTEKTFIALLLLTIHCWKRLYETTHVSVFSDAKINISHYIVGYVHYIGAITCIVGESRGFVDNSQVDFHWNNLTGIDYLCIFIFLAATFLQLHSNYILSGLRKNKKGAVITKSYKIPRGGLFEFITGALQFTEIIMYLVLTIILWESSTYHYVFLWVLINQTGTAITSHVWYKSAFKDYPTNRRILIPFII